jgi:hypothetical protein
MNIIIKFNILAIIFLLASGCDNNDTSNNLNNDNNVNNEEDFVDTCAQFSDNKTQCLANGCDYLDQEYFDNIYNEKRANFKAIYEDNHCIVMEKNNCSVPVEYNVGNAESIQCYFTDDSAYLQYSTDSLILYPEGEWMENCRDFSCHPTQEICQQKTTVEDCQNSYCIWVEAEVATLEENTCSGFSGETISYCSANSIHFSIHQTPFMLYKATTDGTELIRITNFSSLVSQTKIVFGYEQPEFIWWGFAQNDGWHSCQEEDNPICNCPEQ